MTRLSPAARSSLQAGALTGARLVFSPAGHIHRRCCPGKYMRILHPGAGTYKALARTPLRKAPRRSFDGAGTSVPGRAALGVHMLLVFFRCTNQLILVLHKSRSLYPRGCIA